MSQMPRRHQAVLVKVFLARAWLATRARRSKPIVSGVEQPPEREAIVSVTDQGGHASRSDVTGGIATHAPAQWLGGGRVVC